MSKITINEKDTYHLLLYLMKNSTELIVDNIHIKKIHNKTFPIPHFIYTQGMDFIVKDENWLTTNPEKIKLHNTLKKLVRKEKIRFLLHDFNI